MSAEEKRRLWEEARERGGLDDDFAEMSGYWDYRKDNYAGFEHEDSVLRLWMGPTEALYYSNAEIADGDFDYLPWTYKTLEVKARLVGRFFGSAGWGFWNYTMVIDNCVPIWFIYLMTRGPYPLKGFFAQVGNQFQPIVIFEKDATFKLASLLSGIAPSITGIRILSETPSMQTLSLDQWHTYTIEWRETSVVFSIDGSPVATIPYTYGPVGARADAWIDNAVYEVRRGDPGKVYRHVTQENRRRSYLEIDRIRVY